MGVTGKHAREPEVKVGSGVHVARRGEVPRAFLGVGAQLLDSVTASRAPDHRGPPFAGSIPRPVRVAILPPVNHVSPPLGLHRPPCRQVQHRGHHRDDRVSLDPTAFFQPAQPAFDRRAAAGEVDLQPDLLHQAAGCVDVPGGDRILQCLLGQAAALAPGGRAAPHDRH